MFNRLVPAFALSSVVATAFAMPGPVALAFAPTVAKAKPIDGQVFIKIKAGKEAAVASAYKAQGYTVISTIPRIGWQLVKVPAGKTVSAAMSKLKTITGVTNACLNYVPKVFDTNVNDPRRSEQYSLQRMQVPAAWDYSTSAPEIVVGVLDTGVDYNHPDLVNKVIKGRDFSSNDEDPMDAESHGTHVAGIVAAQTNNGIGVAGVGYNAKILAVRCVGGGATFAESAQAVIYAADQGVKVINMSFGLEGINTLPVMDDAIAYAADTKNVVMVAAAGNSGDAGNLHGYPAFNSRCLAVGASDRNDAQSSFTQYNTPGDAWVDVAAPGVSVLSTIPNSGYALFDGTSMASPNTAGVAALIVSRYVAAGIAYKESDIRKIIQETANPVGTWVSYGRVNAYEAILRTGTAIVENPTPTDPAPRDGTVVGTGAAIGSKDGISATINSASKPGVGLVGSFTTSFTMSEVSRSELSSAKMTLIMSGDAFATLQLYFYDSARGEWVLHKAQPMSSTTKTTTLSFTKATLAQYMQGNTLPVLFRSLVPVNYANRSKGVTKIDQASVTFTGYRIGAPPTNP